MAKNYPTTYTKDKPVKTIKYGKPIIAPQPGKKRPDYGTNDTRTLLEKIPSEMVELKLDDVLAAVKEVDNRCDYEHCKVRTSLMGHDCHFCRKRYCFKHGLPEVHGCGEAVKQEERKNFLKPKPAKSIRQEQDLAKAKGRLTAKLKNMQLERMPKANQSSSTGAAKKRKGK